jgi:hypothetical protein
MAKANPSKRASPAPALRVLGDFAGTWDILRHIRPSLGATAPTAASAEPTRFEGRAVWTPDQGGLAYIERGTLTLPGAAPMTAERRYRWTADLSVYFDDGRFFHSVPAGGGATAHWCDPDSYAGRYDFSAWDAGDRPAFEVTWRVQGPRKNYSMHSRFTRLAGPQGPHHRGRKEPQSNGLP